ncbi:MAG: TRAP transporter substrate-binding protein DctP [Deinococcales bacterium]
MERREFLKKAGLAVAASTALSPNVFAQGGGKMSFEMVTSWPTSLDTIHGGATNFAKYVSEMTGGDIEIEVYPAGAQVGGLEVFDAVSNGAFTFGHTASYYYVGKDPAHAFFTAIPFGLNVNQQDSWVHSGGGQELWDELNADFNLRAYLAGNTGVQMGGWFNKEINSAADLQGLKMRIPGLGGQVRAKAGVNVQVLPGGEIYLALERGVIDATEWVGPYDDEILGFNKVAKYYYTPGWHEPGAALGVYMNLDEWSSWPEDIQNIMRAAAAKANQQMMSDYDAKNGAAFARLQAAGVEVRLFPREVLDALNSHMQEIHQDAIAASPMYAKIYEPWVKFRDEVRSFHKYQEYAWHQYVYGA